VVRMKLKKDILKMIQIKKKYSKVVEAKIQSDDDGTFWVLKDFFGNVVDILDRK